MTRAERDLWLWLREARRILTETCGPEPGLIRVVVAYQDTGHGAEFKLPEEPPGREPARYDTTEELQLREVHRNILEAAPRDMTHIKRLAELAGYKLGSYFRTAVAELVRHNYAKPGQGLLRGRKGHYCRANDPSLLAAEPVVVLPNPE